MNNIRHFKKDNKNFITLCNGRYQPYALFENDPKKVTCLRCLKKLYNNSYSKGREGNVYEIDGHHYKLIEDNGDRGMFEYLGSKMSIRPVNVFEFTNDMKLVKNYKEENPNKENNMKSNKNPNYRIRPDYGDHHSEDYDPERAEQEREHRLEVIRDFELVKHKKKNPAVNINKNKKIFMIAGIALIVSFLPVFGRDMNFWQRIKSQTY